MSDLITDLESLARDFDADPNQHPIGGKVVRDAIVAMRNGLLDPATAFELSLLADSGAQDATADLLRRASVALKGSKVIQFPNRRLS